jgi:ribonucleoside-diphosphate reductase alpha chain
MNLSAYVKEWNVGLEGFDKATFKADVKTLVRFLDNVLEVNVFALDSNREMSQRLRRLGLGIMGLADALIKMGLRYNSPEGRDAIWKIITTMRGAAVAASEQLAEERGPFPDCDKSSLTTPRRNVAVVTVAPTGTTSMLMGVSSGVEPIFAPFIYRKIGDGYAALISPLFQELLEQHPPHPKYASFFTTTTEPGSELTGGTWDWDKVVEAVQANHGSVQGLDFIPADVRQSLVCAHDVSPEEHVRMQATVQQAYDGGGDMAANSLSKTINMPNSATQQDVLDAYALAYETRCKGITVYRDGSRSFQVLSTSSKKDDKKAAAPKSEGDDTPTNAPEAVAPTPVRNQGDRPQRLEGFTDTVKLTLPTGEKRSFYVTVNSHEGRPYEIFMNSGKAGEESNADSEALGRLASKALQHGIPVAEIIDTLRGISGGMYGSYENRLVASKADLIAVALESASKGAPDGSIAALYEGVRCQDCGGPVKFENGCQTCQHCGSSKCG